MLGDSTSLFASACWLGPCHCLSRLVALLVFLLVLRHMLFVFQNTFVFWHSMTWKATFRQDLTRLIAQLVGPFGLAG